MVAGSDIWLRLLYQTLPILLLLRLRLRLDMVETSLKDPKRFKEGLAILQSQDFEKKEIKRVFNAYSDNIYYLVSSHPQMVRRINMQFSCQTVPQ